ncbi:MAG: restriction endonuclease [Bacteroidota bacterium]|uniref:restriction endonuclease n=1 Tax=Croceimicrobium sp. TaxID=2828340 RepID=UPI0029C1EBB3|nr:restriction endonuclease [Bacteroidota bacterium]MDX5448259.1 restriction endonuclease [Bacteroidota bacterium]MDX5506425.1 restriction endonuclease [Bacteroidota bacterium]
MNKKVHQNRSEIQVKKYSGEIAPFEQDKLISSLQRSGAKADVIEQVVQEVEKMLYNGISTKEIYKKAFSLLKKKARPIAARYNLKKALFEFGPTGFPFESFIAELLHAKGFQAKTDQLVQGNCVQHEVDVVAEKDNKHFMVECKFHSDRGRFCDVKIPLYIQSRFKDVEKVWRNKKGHQNKFHQGWVATNTRFTSDAIQYGKCIGLHLISWDYPQNESLKNWIDETHTHPVTALTTISRKEKQALLDSGIILCRQLCTEKKGLEVLNLSDSRQRKVMEEARGICEYHS